ncbi:MAG: HAD family hydrolase [Candidatus Thorarchaeota archaeon]
MQFQAFLFDLDGTLINFDPEEFVRLYLGAASQFFIDLIPDPHSFVKEILDSTDIMENSDNELTTALDDFLFDFCPKFKADCEEIRQRFLQFYETKFDVVKPVITPMDGAKELLLNIREKMPETKIVLATNPVFPFISIKRRIEWGGLSPGYFDHITHAENSKFCKGNSKYWFEIVNLTNREPSKTLVIGNDGWRDMSAKKLGFKTFLLESTLENEDYLTEETMPDFRGSIKDLSEIIFN